MFLWSFWMFFRLKYNSSKSSTDIYWVMYQLIPKLLIPPSPRAFNWSFALYSGEVDPNEALQVGHLTVASKCWSASQAKGFCNSFIQHVHLSYGSLLLYSLFCLRIWKPLKKPIKCGLSEKDNFMKWPNLRKTAFRDLIFQWCLVGN